MDTSQIPLFKVFMNPDIDITNTLTSGLVTHGPRVEELEEKLRERFSNPYVVTVNSATSGLTIALRLLNLQPGDIVLSTPFTCIATNTPILANNLKIQWVDTDPNTCNMDLDDLKRKITKETKAVMIMLWGGYPVDYDKLQEIKQYTSETFGHELYIIEDCAHAFMSNYKGKLIGNSGNICVFSFQAIKHLTTGDGGLIILPNKELYERARLLRWFGIDRVKRNGGGDFRLETDVVEYGYKMNMNDINASIGLQNLSFVDKNIAIMRDNTKYYREQLKDLEGLTLLEQKDGYDSSCWIFTFKIKNKPEFIEYMKYKGIMTSQVHNRNDIHTCFSEFKCSLPQLDELEKVCVSIPCGWWVNNNDRFFIVNCIREFLKQ